MTVVLATLLFAPWLAAEASAAPGRSPLAGLTAAGVQLGVLAGEARSPASRHTALAAQGEVARATAPALWIDPSHVLAPGYGLVVFSGSRAALVDLEHAPAGSLPSADVSAVETDILAADRGLAEAAIIQARGGSGGLLQRASGMILSGDRWAGTSRLDLAAEQYGTAWRDAFQALIELVRVRVAFVSPAALGAAASRALRTGSPTRPAGVHVLAGRRALTGSGKPELLFVGLASCPACAVEQWGLAVALSRFGTFSNLRLGQSAVAATPFVRSVAFSGARYVSPYVSFDPIELSSDLPAPGGGFQALDRLTPSQGRLVRALDPSGIAPFIDVGNRFADVGAAESPGLAASLSWSQLAVSLDRPRTQSGQAIDATAELLTAEICRVTGGLPASVCAGAVVQRYSSRLGRFGGRGGGCAVAAAGRSATARRTTLTQRTTTVAPSSR